jgi:hypothetical protein
LGLGGLGGTFVPRALPWAVTVSPVGALRVRALRIGVLFIGVFRGRLLQSIPTISFIEFDLVLFQQSAVFILKRYLTMVFFLAVNVSLDTFSMRRADRKHSVSTLPMEILIDSPFCLDPFRESRLYLLNEIRRRTRPWMRHQ